MPSSSTKKHLLTFYTRTPLHVGSGATVGAVDLPIIRERITNHPIIPGSGLKGVLLQAAREKWGDARSVALPDEAKLLFGTADEKAPDSSEKSAGNAGCIQIQEGKLLAFPVRSVAGGFAWLTCPSALHRFNRDTGRKLPVPSLAPDHVIAGTELKAGNNVVLEEYALILDTGSVDALAKELAGICQDPLWRDLIGKRLAVVHDENFQHFVTTCTEVVTRIAINPATRTVAGTALFNQENVPCETLFYSVLTVLPGRRANTTHSADTKLAELLPATGLLLQIGGDETTGHGQCDTFRTAL